MNRKIFVTKSVVPPLQGFVSRLESIWAAGQFTNHGPQVEELEARLRDRLGVRHCLLTCNGTVALQIAIRALELRGDVVTTPFSYVATTSSLVWEGCRPVFADIDAATLCIDPERVADACTPATSGILATHVYGNACDIEALTGIARARGLKLLFDAAHAFDARYRGRALAAQGDAAVLSLHATKLFHTGEGGAVLTDDDEIASRVQHLRNFGHEGYEAFAGLGINGKMSELHAALGLSVLPLVDQEIERRRALTATYELELEGSGLQRVSWRAELERNFAYFPVLMRDEVSLQRARAALEQAGIFPRRYFFPSLNRLPYVAAPEMPIAENAASRVLCLPTGGDVSSDDAARIVGLLRSAAAER